VQEGEKGEKLFVLVEGKVQVISNLQISRKKYNEKNLPKREIYEMKVAEFDTIELFGEEILIEEVENYKYSVRIVSS
jgi:hypothetical protein